jgi:preprotein translocase subunit SecG
MWYTLTIVFHVIVSLALIAIVLLQTGKGAEMGAALRGSSQTLFGGTSGTTFLGKLTTGAAVAFMLTCLLLNVLTTGPGPSRSLMEDAPVQQAPSSPSIPQPRPVPGPDAPSALPGPPAAPDAAAPAPQGSQSSVRPPVGNADNTWPANAPAQQSSTATPAKAPEQTPAKKQ